MLVQKIQKLSTTFWLFVVAPQGVRGPNFEKHCSKGLRFLNEAQNTHYEMPEVKKHPHCHYYPSGTKLYGGHQSVCGQ